VVRHTRQEDDPDAPPGPTVEVSREGPRTVVWVRGDHDVSTAGGLGTALDIARTMGTDDVVVDLAGTTFLDGAIVRVIARRAPTADSPVRLSLRRPSGAVHRVLAVCGMDGLVEPAPVMPSEPVVPPEPVPAPLPPAG